MNNSYVILRYSARLPVIGKYLGQLLLLLSLLTVAPILAAIIFGEYEIMYHYLQVAVLLLVISIPMTRIASPAQIQSNEAMAISALTFLLSPLIMSYPLMSSGLAFSDAMFEAISAITTTGLTTVTELQSRPHTFLFARAWMQWYGGLGIVVLSIALLMGNQLVARQLTEPLGSEIMPTTARAHARRMLFIYLVISAFGLVVLWTATGDGFSALVHMLSAVSTGGFAPHDSSLGAYNDLTVRYSVILLSLCGAIPLPLYYLFWRRQFGSFFGDIELHGLIIFSVLACALLVLSLYFLSGYSWNDSFSHGLLLGLSAQTTSGFSSTDVSGFDDSTKIITILSMLSGGGMGSTAGGFKIVRLLILMRLIHLLIIRTTMPSHAILKLHLGQRILTGEDIQRAILLILLFIIVTVLSWLVFVSYGYPPLDSLFEVVSAIGTVGLSTGITSAELPSLLKGVLCVDMLLGRLEIVAILILLYPPTWFGKRAE